MREIGRIALLACVCALSGTAPAFDNGQYDNVSPDSRAWFKGVTAPNGVPRWQTVIAPTMIFARALIGFRSKDNG
jgi:hypothetical protein